MAETRLTAEQIVNQSIHIVDPYYKRTQLTPLLRELTQPFIQLLLNNNTTLQNEELKSIAKKTAELIKLNSLYIFGTCYTAISDPQAKKFYASLDLSNLFADIGDANSINAQNLKNKFDEALKKNLGNIIQANLKNNFLRYNRDLHVEIFEALNLSPRTTSEIRKLADTRKLKAAIHYQNLSMGVTVASGQLEAIVTEYKRIKGSNCKTISRLERVQGMINRLNEINKIDEELWNDILAGKTGQASVSDENDELTSRSSLANLTASFFPALYSPTPPYSSDFTLQLNVIKSAWNSYCLASNSSELSVTNAAASLSRMTL